MSAKSAVQLLDDLIAELTVAVPVATVAATPAPIKTEKKAKKTEESKPKPVPAAVKPDTLDVNAIDLRVGVIVKVDKHPTAEKLYVEEIDVGEETPRAIASGLVPHYTLEEMQNRRLIVVCNLKPRNLVGFKSHGMVLCAVKKDGDNEKVEFVDPPANAKPGDRIVGENLAVYDALSPSQVDKQKAFEKIAADFVVDADGNARWGEYKLVTLVGEPCTAPTVRNGVLH